jgi:hypothetical protein
MYRCDAVGVQLTALVDRDVLARDETFICEVKPDLVRHFLCGVIVKRPAPTLTMNKMTMVVLPVRPQSCDPACLAMLPPERRIDPVVLVERCNDDICESVETVPEEMYSGSIWEMRFACGIAPC